MEVAKWIEEFGLGEHAALFAENRIDAEVLPELTEEDLHKLGLPLGDRRRLLKAIRDLSNVPLRSVSTTPQHKLKLYVILTKQLRAETTVLAKELLEELEIASTNV